MEPIQQSHSITTRAFLGCDIDFAHGASVERITTSFESTSVLISNLPPNTTNEEVIELAEPFGELPAATIDPLSSLLKPGARIHYATLEEAAKAVEGLNGTMFRSSKLVAQMERRRGTYGPASLSSNKVKVSWFSPSRIAWAHYRTITQARTAAQQINGTELNGRQIRAAFQNPGYRQTESFSIELKGLPRHVTMSTLSHLCKAQSISMGPQFTDQDDSAVVRRLLMKYGPLDSFDLMPLDDKRTKAVAFAQFNSADAAVSAVKALHDQKQMQLRRSPLWVEVVHAVKLAIPRALFVVIHSHLDSHRQTHEDSSLRYYEENGDGEAVDPVGIRLYGPDPKAIGRGKIDLDRILAGEPLTSEGAAVWDDHFATLDGKMFLAGLANASAYAKLDIRTRSIALYGSAKVKAKLQSEIISELDRVLRQREAIPLEKQNLQTILSRMQELHGIAGADKLSFDILSRTLTVRGDADVVRKVRLAVKAIAAGAAVPPSLAQTDDSCCPVCFCEVADPTRLPCGHSYCRACLQLLMQSASGPNFTPSSLECVASSTEDTESVPCKSKIPLSIIHDLLPAHEETRLLESAFLAHIHARPAAFRYCPTPDCPMVYKPGAPGTVLLCPTCMASICPACHVEQHEGLTCAEHRDNLAGGAESYRRWREENGVKPCPNCAADLQKNGGCNHIQCVRCRTHMCWVCMQTFSDGGSGGGVYEHMRTAHGGIGM